MYVAGELHAENPPPSIWQLVVPSDAVNEIVALRTFTVPDGPEVIDTDGAVVSVTVTVKLPLTVLPPASVTLQPTVVVPRGKLDPDGGEQDGVSGVAPSDPVAAYVTVADVPFTLVAMGAGRVRVGGVVSVTVTLKLPLVVLPAPSVAEQFTVLEPIGNTKPEVGEQTTDSGPASVAVGEYVTAAEPTPLTSTVIGARPVSTGNVVS